MFGSECRGGLPSGAVGSHAGLLALGASGGLAGMREGVSRGVPPNQAGVVLVLSPRLFVGEGRRRVGEPKVLELEVNSSAALTPVGCLASCARRFSTVVISPSFTRTSFIPACTPASD